MAWSMGEIIFHVERTDIFDIAQRPNRVKYLRRRVFVIANDNYARFVPSAESEEQAFLKTAIPSRKATKRYLGEKKK